MARHRAPTRPALVRARLIVTAQGVTGAVIASGYLTWAGWLG
jgi:hypothetical protein